MAAGSGDRASSSTAPLAGPSPRGRQDLPSSTPNPELIQPPQNWPALQHPPNITHQALLCPSPTGSSSSIPGSLSEPTASLSFLTSLFVSASHHDPLSSCAMPEITSLLPAPGASSSTLICPERLQPVPGTLPTGRFPKQAHLSLPNANLLIQLLAPLRFFLYLSFSRAPLPPLLHISKPLPSP